MKRRSRAVKGSDLAVYNWTAIPRSLLDAFRRKCRSQDPPVTMSYQLTRLVGEWIGAHRPKASTPTTTSAAPTLKETKADPPINPLF